ncbi:asparagine synthase-related protein [Nocardia terpenica]|uniref:asparagine synthase (glutamine-hydrolyzing) n=1 Tax=Nocardia terpenica TaxID=455432 RepID=A0A291RMK6_9NOCA|nr:asparagine synthase-related protein [Nocardia terpenica]ATL68803.1 asparagine synthase [Nocardia terpenica]
MNALAEGFLVFPDSPGGAMLFRQFSCTRAQFVTHASGRPWLAGHWEEGALTVAQAGSVRVAVSGLCPVSPERLAVLAGRIEKLSDADSLARALPGSVHLIVSVGGRVRVQGTVTGTRAVFTTALHGVSIAGDRADVLAALTRAEPDDELLAAKIAGPQFLTPLTERSWWRGVRRVAPDSYLALGGDTGAEVVRWWTAPEPNLPLAEGIPAVREALHTAVAARRPARGLLSADLSGGMDSTSLCFLAADHDADLLLFRWTDGTAINDDPAYAERAAGLLHRARQLELRSADIPRVFSPPYALPDTEAPASLVRGVHARWQSARLLAAEGSTVHLSGHGGDELFSGDAAYLWSLFRRDPIRALARLRAHRVLGRWPLLASVRGILASETFDAWWRRCADGLVDPSDTDAPVSWGPAPAATPWASSYAVGTCAGIYREVAVGIAPLADDRGQHAALSMLRSAASQYRQLCRNYAAAGLRWETPLVDDRVVEAVLAIRTSDRFDPWRFKPVLAEAMSGVAPDFILNRYTKGDYDGSVEADLRHHVRDLLELFSDSALASRGLIDGDRLREFLLRPPRGEYGAHLAALERTLGGELWLRAIEDRKTDSCWCLPSELEY